MVSIWETPLVNFTGAPTIYQGSSPRPHVAHRLVGVGTENQVVKRECTEGWDGEKGLRRSLPGSEVGAQGRLPGGTGGSSWGTESRSEQELCPCWEWPPGRQMMGGTGWPGRFQHQSPTHPLLPPQAMNTGSIQPAPWSEGTPSP